MRTELTAFRFILFVGISLLLFLIALLLAPWIGATKIQPGSIFSVDVDPTQGAIFWQLRVPRVLLAALAGWGLALAGAGFQALLRNPLASPYILGISAGSSLGAVIAIKLGITLTLITSPILFTFALIGALAAITIVYSLARSRGGISIATLLLAGVTLNFFFSAVILLVQYLSSPGEAYQMIRWMMGAVDIAGYRQLFIVAITVGAGSLLFFFNTRTLNILTLDDSSARYLGVNVVGTQKLIFFAASLITAGIVSVCGPIGFVGLIIPHLVRLICGADHRLVLPCSAFIGGAFLIAADTIARKLLAPVELPVGVITALCGGPFFLFLLLHYKRSNRMFF